MQNNDLLVKLPLFEGMPADDIPVILKRLGSYSKKYKRNDFIKTAGDPIDFIGIVC